MKDKNAKRLETVILWALKQKVSIGMWQFLSASQPLLRTLTQNAPPPLRIFLLPGMQ